MLLFKISIKFKRILLVNNKSLKKYISLLHDDDIILRVL